MRTTTLLALPSEILSQILSRLAYQDLVSFASTGHQARNFCSPSRNQLLWQAVFLHKFDDPRDRWSSLTRTPREQILDKQANFDWHAELKKRVIALHYVTGGRLLDNQKEGEDENYEGVIEALLDIVDTAKACPTNRELQAGKKPTVDDRDLSLNLGLLPINYHFEPEFDGLVRGIPASAVRINSRHKDIEKGGLSTLMMLGGRNWDTPGRALTRSQAAREMDKLARSENASRLHVLCGLTEWEERDDKAVGRARRIVYDWNTTNAENEYGLWKGRSGETDWRRLEAVVTVVARQFALAVRGRMTLPQGFCFSLPYRTLTDPTVPDDWAGVQGLWCGTYVFLHWEDLVEFNMFANAANRPTLENGPEACGGLMQLELKLDMDVKGDSTLKTNLPVCEDLPPLYFSGQSRSYDYRMATAVRGMCCLAPGGREVRWRYIIHYSGQDQWQLEGVQPGGIRSGCVYGTWTSVLHDDGGPVGPFLYAPGDLCKPTTLVPVR